MDPQSDLNIQGDIQEVLADAPKPIRDFFARRGTEGVTKHLMQKYNLHIDQAAVLEREIILLLLGLEDPEEFGNALAKETHLDPQTVGKVMVDINAQIFMPLRDEMRKAEVKREPPKGPPPPSYQPKPPPPKPPPPAPPSINQIQRTPPASGGGPAFGGKPWSPQDAILIPANPTLPPRPPEPASFGGMSKYIPPKPQPSRPLSSQPSSQRPLENNKLLADHEEPHINVGNDVPRPAVAFGEGGPPNLPGAMPPPPRPAPPKPPPAAPYTTDPYREPLE